VGVSRRLEKAIDMASEEVDLQTWKSLAIKPFLADVLGVS